MAENGVFIEQHDAVIVGVISIKQSQIANKKREIG
jgi:hypothetical protein